MNETVTINCDHCDWSTKPPWETLPDWEGETCPECGHVVVNKRDVLLWKGTDLLKKLGVLDMSSDKTDEDTYEITINTDPDKPLITLKEE